MRFIVEIYQDIFVIVDADDVWDAMSKASKHGVILNVYEC